MSTSGDSSKISLETVLNLKDRLKHGQNVTKILESQLDTAQQNISLLQGQIRLANETILNLKKHFRETENILSQFLSPEQLAKWSSYDNDNNKDSDGNVNHKNGGVDSTTRSPLPSGAVDSNKGFEEKSSDIDKSPYAIQLRQVLDVLDEEPRKYAQHDGHKDCNFSECQLPSQKRYDDCDCGNTPYSGDQYYHHRNEDIPHYHHQHHHRKNEEHCKSKYKVNGHVHRSDSPKNFARSELHVPHTTSYSHNCSGPCCVNTASPTYKIVDKQSALHYANISSPQRLHDKHNDRHCSEKCQSHYVNYVPYGYHVADSVAAGIPESLQPLSPSRRKRPYMHLIPAEEPPHLKYTKVKRIDGSKLTAQKVLQDFTRRRFLPYNPRYDLDLLIVPPPIPATELIRNKSMNVKKTNESLSTPSPPLQNKNFPDCEDISLDRSNGLESSPQNTSSYIVTNMRNERSSDNNNNDNTNALDGENMIAKTSYNLINSLPVIKEEQEEGRVKHENHSNKMLHNRSKSPKITQRTSFFALDDTLQIQPESNNNEVMK